MAAKNARLRPRHQEDVRKKIQADRIIAWLQAGIFGDKFQGREVALTAEKISAAKTLLNKCLADLTRAEITGEDGGAVRVLIAGADKSVL